MAIFVVSLKHAFLFEKQFLDLLTLRRIGSDFEQFPIVLNVLAYDKTLHDNSRQGRQALS